MTLLIAIESYLNNCVENGTVPTVIEFVNKNIEIVVSDSKLSDDLRVVWSSRVSNVARRMNIGLVRKTREK